MQLTRERWEESENKQEGEFPVVLFPLAKLTAMIRVVEPSILQWHTVKVLKEPHGGGTTRAAYAVPRACCPPAAAAKGSYGRRANRFRIGSGTAKRKESTPIRINVFRRDFVEHVHFKPGTEDVSTLHKCNEIERVSWKVFATQNIRGLVIVLRWKTRGL